MSGIDATALVIAKAPIAGFAKTRLTPPFSPREAAQLAAAALLDTLTAVRHSGIRHRVVAWTGELERAERAEELAAELAGFTLVPQRGDSFGHRLANAHHDAAAPGRPVLQIGMDTPQAGPAVLAAAANGLLDCGDTVLGAATDGGWWALGLTDPGPARVLTEVPMSTGSTGERTRKALRECGCRIRRLPTLSDVDTVADAIAVAGECRGYFSHAFARIYAGDAPERDGMPALGARRG
ncbi:TIGR04282 family arsenosugar biosynthesis glycosyltransferase [Nocardia blacklockiae]|uniref:TIGR04282 family arsenosugar biosynthesis glycosyltransferase n=1 Tax=Nocardia blacklockiae TaxID=480036 RepID=UPI00189411BB|nr:DUF2064 domain-containing protein [Nocardia blacklockiae]MBF6176563.1 DUF2064 domain-containing protein [Nocardia blacklockiae]